MSTDNNSNAKSEMWSEAKELGGEYSPRNKRRVKGTTRKKRQYKSPYKRARDAYIEKNLGHRYIRYSRRLTDIKEAKVKSEYIAKTREKAAAVAPIKTDIWNAYKSENISFLGRGIHWNDDIHWRSNIPNSSGANAGSDFYDVYKREERIEKNGIPDFNTPNELATALDLDISKLRWLTYHREAATYIHYHSFDIPKKSGGVREIWAPNKLLKEKQRWVLDNIIHKIPVHGAAHGFVPGCSIFSNAKMHINSKYIISMDIKNFFPTFTFKRVKGIFRQIGYLDGIATLLTLLCTEAPREVVEYDGTKYFVAVGDRCLPQGSPASPGLTNIACMRLDRRLDGLASKFGWRYTRYADDITFSSTDASPSGIEALKNFIISIVEDEGFEIHDGKTTVMGRATRQKVTGLVVNNDGDPRTPTEVRRMLRAAIHNLKSGKGFKEGESLATLIGFAAFVYSTNKEQGEKFMNELLELPEDIVK